MQCNGPSVRDMCFVFIFLTTAWLHLEDSQQAQRMRHCLLLEMSVERMRECLLRAWDCSLKQC